VNLHDCRVPYTVVSNRLLNPHLTPSALTVGLQAYRDKGLRPLEKASKYLTRHERRIYTETSEQLQQVGILEEGVDGELKLKDIVPEDRICVPSELGYSTWSSPETRTYLGLLSFARGKRSSFEVLTDFSSLADEAGTSLRSVKTAVPKLKERSLIRAVRVWRKGIHYAMLDPEGSGWELTEIGQFYQQRLDTIPVHTRYKDCLAQCDPRGHLAKTSGLGVSGYTVICPFCRSTKKTFRFTSLEEEDHWQCFNCRKKGDSVRLWTKLMWHADRDSFRTALATAGVADTAAAAIGEVVEDAVISEGE
jgi:hypothetical protein